MGRAGRDCAWSSLTGALRASYRCQKSHPCGFCRTPFGSEISPQANETKKPPACGGFFVSYGAPGEIRTPDLMVRSHALYPTELRARIELTVDRWRPERKSRAILASIVQFHSSIVGTRRDAAVSDPSTANRRRVNLLAKWRRERDSNPRWAFDPYTLSRGAPSTTRPSLRGRPAN